MIFETFYILAVTVRRSAGFFITSESSPYSMLGMPPCERANMKSFIASFGVILLFATTAALAQDSHYRPERQQFPAPSCHIMKGAWEGGSRFCTAEDHEAW